MGPSPTSLAHAVAAVLLRQEANTRSLISIFATTGAEAEHVAAELRAMAEGFSGSAQMLSSEGGCNLAEALEAAADTIGAGEPEGAEPLDCEGRAHA